MSWCWGPNDHGYYCAIFPFCGGGKKKTKKTKAFYDWATTGIPVKTGINLKKHEDWVTGKHEQRDSFFHLIGWGGDASFLANRREEHSKTGFSSTIRPDCLRKSNKRIFSCNEWLLLFFQIHVGIPDVIVITFKPFFLVNDLGQFHDKFPLLFQKNLDQLNLQYLP